MELEVAGNGAAAVEGNARDGDYDDDNDDDDDDGGKDGYAA